LVRGQFADLEGIAKEQGVDRSCVGRMLQRTSLAPEIVESILAGQAFAAGLFATELNAPNRNAAAVG
jgi:hypothetical protein